MPVTLDEFRHTVRELPAFNPGGVERRGLPEPEGPLGHVLDVLGRPNYAVAGAVDTLMNEPGFQLGRAIKTAASELVSPEQRLGFRDVIAKNDPTFAANNPGWTVALGLAADIALDPTTYLTIGGSAAVKATASLARGTRQAGRLRAGRLAGMAEAKALKAQKITSGPAFEAKVKAASDEAMRQFTNTKLPEFNLNAAGKERLKVLIGRHTRRGSTSARATAGHELASLMDSTPALREAFEDTSVVRFMGSKILGKEHLGTFVEATGLGRAARAISSAKLVGKAVDSVWKPIKDTLGGAFKRDYGLPEEFVARRHELEDSLLVAERDIKKEAREIFGALNEKERTKVGKVAADIDRLMGLEVESRLSATGASHLSKDDLAYLMARQRDLINSAQLTDPQERALLGFRQKMKDIARIEQEAGLLEHAQLFYSPRVYDNLVKAGEEGAVRTALQRNLPNFLGPNEARMIEDLDQAKKLGLNPVEDAAVLFTLRAMQSQRALQRKMFNEATEAMFPGFEARRGVVKGAPERVLREIKYLGESVYSGTTEPELNTLFRVYDKSMSLFRASATIMRPAFAARQAVSNSIQSFLLLGRHHFGGASLAGDKSGKGMSMFDPRSWRDAWTIINGGSGKVGITTALGERLSGQQLSDEIWNQGLIKNVTIDGLGRADTPRYAKQLSAEFNKAALLDRVGTKHGAAAKGLAETMIRAAKYTDFPAHIEDMGHVATYVNARRMGMAPREARRAVDTALFDYVNGLSSVEQRVVRRIVPFYSYQRFAVPLVAQAMVRTPGRVANVKKTAEALFTSMNKIYGGDTMSDSDRHAMPGWLLEQPGAFTGFEKDLERGGLSAQFKLFNNYSPLNVMAFLEGDPDGGGGLNLRETIKKGVLAQMAPHIKLPLEIATGRDFFTGRSLEGASRKSGDIDPDALLSNMVGLISGQLAQRAGGSAGLSGGSAAALTRAITEGQDGVAAEILGSLLGFEEGVDPETGVRATYFSPMRLHMLTSLFPGLNDALKLADRGRPPLDSTTQFLFGVSTVNVHMADAYDWKFRSLDRKVAEAEAALDDSILEGRLDAQQKAQKNLEDVLLAVDSEYTRLTATPNTL